jgi:RHS repeat-associated protein
VAISESYSYASGFKLTGIMGSAGNEVYAHDGGGRLTSVDRGGVHRVMEYDSMDHITKVTDGGMEVERYTFDGMGRRVGVGAGASAKRFLIAPNLGDGYESPQAVTDGSGNVIATYVYAGEHPIMKIGAGGTVEYLLADSMGSVIGKASGAGASTASIKYTAFGEVASAVGASAGIDSSVGAEPRFHGMTLDAGTGLYFVRARTYDARTGRFVSRDPKDGLVQAPERWQPYTYGFSNPHRFSDPSGQEGLEDFAAISSIEDILATTAASWPLWNLFKPTQSGACSTVWAKLTRPECRAANNDQSDLLEELDDAYDEWWESRPAEFRMWGPISNICGGPVCSDYAGALAAYLTVRVPSPWVYARAVWKWEERGERVNWMNAHSYVRATISDPVVSPIDTTYDPWWRLF